MVQRGSILIVAALLLVTAVPAGVHAQDFLFGRPHGQLTLRAGPVLHRADGDLFDFFRSELTLDRSDFRAPMLGAEFALYVHPRVDVTVSGSWSRTTSRSEFRDWVGEDDEPIEQVTQLRVVPLTGSVRLYPLSRGRNISDLVWLPARVTPYVGGGGGIAWYRLEQRGEFVALEDQSIFEARLESTGSAALGHVLAGMDYWFTPRIGLNAEGRYSMGSARPDDDFYTWDTIDLTGLQLGVGLTLRW